MSQFYSSEQTQQSREVLEETLAAIPGAILIGGWGSWVRTGGQMSHDIDLIVTRPELQTLKGFVEDLSESRHFGSPKWRASRRGVHLDLYVAHQSRLGANLQLRVEQLAHHAETVRGKRLLTIAGHTATKWAALLDRPDSLPGRKDRYEILRLLRQPGADATQAVIRQASTRTQREVDALLHKGFELLAESDNVTRQDRTALRQRSIAWSNTATPPDDRGTSGPALTR